MASKLRIHVKFGETKVLVPCGDGSIAISKMVEKAIEKYKKAKKLSQDDRIVVSGVYQEAGSEVSVVDVDDDVCDAFNDQEIVLLEYQFIPHDAPPDYVPVTVHVPSADCPPAVSAMSSNQPPPSQITTPSGVPPHPVVNNYKTHNGMGTEIIPPPTAAPASLTTSNKSLPLIAGSVTDSGYQSRYGSCPGGGSSSPPSVHVSMNSNEYMNDEYQEYYSSMPSSNDPEKLTPQQDFEVDCQTNRLSQEIVDPMNGDFSHDVIEQTPSHQDSPSQVSVRSFDGASQPSLGNSQRFTNSPSGNYNMSLLTPSSQGGGYPVDGSSHLSSSHHNLDTTTDKSNLDSPNITSNTFHFSNSQSMEGLNDFQAPSSSGGSRHLSSSGNQGDTGNSPYRSASFHHHPALSQEYVSTHENYSMPQDPYGIVMSQDPHSWSRNPRMINMPPMPGYYPRGPPQYRSQYGPEYGGRPEFDRSSVSSSFNEYDFRSGYPPHPGMYSQQQFMEKEKRRKQSLQDQHESMKTGRGPPHHMPPYPDMFGYQRQYYHGPDEDPSIEIALSQPATYMMYPHQQHPYNRYQNYPSSMGTGMGGPMGVTGGMSRMNSGGRLKNHPSEYSLSQPGGDTRPRNMGYGGGYGRPKKSALRTSHERKSRSDSTSKDSKHSIDEENVSDEDAGDNSDMKPSPFRRSSRKSMFLDDGSVWGRWQEKLDNMDFDEYYGDDVDVPHDESSQRTNTPPSENSKEIGDEEPSDLGHLHIVELLRGDEPLGIQLVSYTSKGRDLGVFIGEMDREGFAAKSGELQLFDRILACNGEDFTGESNRRVEERMREMTSKEPLLRMAVSRGLNLDLENSTDDEDEETQGRDRDITHGSDPSSNEHPNTVDDEIKVGEVSSNAPALVSTSITNTRQLGVRKTIELKRGAKGTFGFGLASRDVTTNDEIPLYVKSISTGGPAFEDGKLKIGDRILEVNGVSVKGMSQSEVLNLLRNSKESVMIVISRQQLSMEPQDEYSELSQPTDQGPLPAPIGKNVLMVNIPLDDCGLHGLGVTVYGRCSKKREDVGIYIKSIQPGGAAAKEGSLRVNDRLLSVNQQSLVNISNASALEALKKGLQQAQPGVDSNIRLTIARTAGINRKLSLSMSSFTTQMPALQEEDRGGLDGENTTEIGIDCPPETTTMSQELDHDTLYEEEYNFTSQTSSGSQISYGKPQEVLDLSVGSFPSSQGPSYNLSKTEYEARSNQVANNQPSASSLSTRRTAGKDGGSTPKNHRRDPSDYLQDRASKHSPSPRPNLPALHNDKTKYSQRHSSLSPTSEKIPWHMGGDPSQSKVSSQSRRSSHSRGSSHSPTASYSRPSSVHSELSDKQTNQMTRISSLQSINGPASYGHVRGHVRVGSGSFRRKMSPPYDTLEQSPTKERKKVNQSQSSPHTLPRQGSGRKASGRSIPHDQEDVTSLYSYTSDPELDSTIPFQRDDKNRQSIPKKKNTFLHL